MNMNDATWGTNSAQHMTVCTTSDIVYHIPMSCLLHVYNPCLMCTTFRAVKYPLVCVSANTINESVKAVLSFINHPEPCRHPSSPFTFPPPSSGILLHVRRMATHVLRPRCLCGGWLSCRRPVFLGPVHQRTRQAQDAEHQHQDDGHQEHTNGEGQQNH
jgi:hypothetical protein